MVRHAKGNFVSDNQNNYKNDSKKFWKSLSDILPNKSNKNPQKIYLKDELDTIVLDNKIAADMMNNFFTSIGPKLAKDMRDPWVYTGNISPYVMDDMHTDKNEVLKYIKEIVTSKASAVPNIASKVLKPALITLIDQITFIFNLCFRQNTLPTNWKITSIIHLPTEGDLTKCTNYRPISLLPLPGKLLEHIIHSRIISYCDEHNILNENQGGFRKNHSTTATVAKFTDNLYQSINDKTFSIATFVDFLKAFDTVYHEILLHKLEKIGIKGNSKLLIKNYLENRKQLTNVNGTDSDLATVTCGVPQGSVVGPL